MSRISMKDIAAQANVSTATVSYVINGTRNVRSKTRERVLEVIQQLNYKPNDIAKSLKRRRTNTIGVIAEDVTVFNVPEIIDGIHDYADRHDMHVLLTNLRLDKRIGKNFTDVDIYRKYAEEAVSELLSKQVEGVIYISIHTRDLTGLIDTGDRPLVFTYGYAQTHASVQYNDEQAAFDAMTYLVKQGHRRIALISGGIDSMPSRLRLQGYYRSVTEWELPFDPELIKIGDWEKSSGYLLAVELLNAARPPTAILAMNDVMAAGVLQAAAELGVAVPGQLSVMGIDNREFCEFLTPRLTTMDLPLHEIGYYAMEEITRMIGPDRSMPGKMLACRLVERDSVAPPAAAPQSHEA